MKRCQFFEGSTVKLGTQNPKKIIIRKKGKERNIIFDKKFFTTKNISRLTPNLRQQQSRKTRLIDSLHPYFETSLYC